MNHDLVSVGIFFSVQFYNTLLSTVVLKSIHVRIF